MRRTSVDQILGEYLKNITKPSPGEHDLLFQHALYHSIYCAAVGEIGRVHFFEQLKAKGNGVDASSLMRLIVEETNHKVNGFSLLMRLDVQRT